MELDYLQGQKGPVVVRPSLVYEIPSVQQSSIRLHWDVGDSGRLTCLHCKVDTTICWLHTVYWVHGLSSTVLCLPFRLQHHKPVHTRQ